MVEPRTTCARVGARRQGGCPRGGCPKGRVMVKAMASRGATPPRTTEWRSRARGRAGGRATPILWSRWSRAPTRPTVTPDAHAPRAPSRPAAAGSSRGAAARVPAWIRADDVAGACYGRATRPCRRASMAWVPTRWVPTGRVTMKAMASRGAPRSGSAAWRSREGVRAQGPAPTILWLALPGIAVLALGASLLAMVPATPVGLAALGVLLVAGGLVARRAVSVVRVRPRSSRWFLPARQAGVAPVGGHRAGREARGRGPGARSGHERERRAVDLCARASLPAERHAWRDR